MNVHRSVWKRRVVAETVLFAHLLELLTEVLVVIDDLVDPFLSFDDVEITGDIICLVLGDE